MSGVLEHPSSLNVNDIKSEKTVQGATHAPHDQHDLLVASKSLESVKEALSILHQELTETESVKKEHVADRSLNPSEAAELMQSSAEASSNSSKGPHGYQTLDDWVALLKELSKELSDLQSVEKKLKAAVEELAKDKAKIQQKVSELESQIKKLEKEKGDLINEVTKLSNGMGTHIDDLNKLSSTSKGLKKDVTNALQGVLHSFANGQAADPKAVLDDSVIDSVNKSLTEGKKDAGKADAAKTPDYWKKWLEKLMQFFQGNWTGADFTNFMLMMLQGVQKEGDMPPDIKAKFQQLLKSVFQKLQEEDPKDFSKMLEDITLELGSSIGFDNAEKLMQEALKEAGQSAQTIDWTDYQKQAAKGWPAIKDQVTKDLTGFSVKYFTPDFRAAIQPSMNDMHWECVKNESIWEKVSDILGTWDYGIFNSIMDVQNMIMQEVQKLRADINSMQQDLDNMANDPNDTKSASDFQAKMKDLKDQESSRWLGSGSGSSGEALDKFLTFLNGWGSKVFDSGKSPSDIAAAVNKIMKSSGSSPSSDQQQITTNFSNITGTFSTASETQSMALQNSETQLDANLKINNSSRQTMTSLIHVITNYSNG